MPEDKSELKKKSIGREELKELFDKAGIFTTNMAEIIGRVYEFNGYRIDNEDEDEENSGEEQGNLVLISGRIKAIVVDIWADQSRYIEVQVDHTVAPVMIDGDVQFNFERDCWYCFVGSERKYTGTFALATEFK